MAHATVKHFCPECGDALIKRPRVLGVWHCTSCNMDFADKFTKTKTLKREKA